MHHSPMPQVWAALASLGSFARYLGQTHALVEDGGSTFPRLPQLNAKCIVHVLTPVLHYLTRTNICSWDYGSASPADSSRSLVGLSISNVACPSQNEHQWITEIHSAWCGLFATTAADTAAEADSEAATDPCTGTESTP